MGIEHESARLLKEILDEIKLLRLDLMALLQKPVWMQSGNRVQDFKKK